MKKFILLISIFCFISMNAQSKLTECEKLLTNYRHVNKNSKWKDFTYDGHYGKILYKEVEYFHTKNPQESKKYWLFQLESNGHYYFGDINKKDNKKFYLNENDAMVALFVWQCSKVYLDQGSVSGQD